MSKPDLPPSISKEAEEIARAYKNGKITGNQARLLCGLPPIKDPGFDELVQVDHDALDGTSRIFSIL